MDRASVLLVAGPPGAGKSTVGRLVAERFQRAVYVESDWFWTTIVRGAVAPWLPEADAQNQVVLRACAAAAAAFARGGYPVVMSGIFGPWFLDLVAAECATDEVELHYVILRPRLEVARERALSRVPLTADAAPLREEGPIRQLWDQFQNLGPREGHVIDNSDEDPGRTAAAVGARWAAGIDRLDGQGRSGP
jgi:predicted kinase